MDCLYIDLQMLFLIFKRMFHYLLADFVQHYCMSLVVFFVIPVVVFMPVSALGGTRDIMI